MISRQKPRLRIAIFHLGFFYSGGGEKLVLEEIRGLRDLGHEVTCYAPYIDRENCFPDVPEMAEIRPLLPPPPKWLPIKDGLWLTLSCILIPFMARRFRSYDVFLGANQPAPWFAYVLSMILRKPYVVYLAQALRVLHPRQVDLENGIRIREGDYRYLKVLMKLGGFFIDWADRTSIRKAQIVLTNGEYVRLWLHDVYDVHTEACPAGCYPQPERLLNYPARWRGKVIVDGKVVLKPYILLTNRHSAHKRFEHALWALKRIHRSAPNLSLLITGQETRYTDQLTYLVEGLGLAGKVHFVGLVSEQDLERLYREAAVYVYPAPEEDYGMGIVEAMGAGVPVVAWNNGGPTGTVEQRKSGFLVEPYDTEEFAEKLLLLATNPALAERMGRAGHSRARRMFSYERHMRILEQALLAAHDPVEEELLSRQQVFGSLQERELAESLPSYAADIRADARRRAMADLGPARMQEPDRFAHPTELTGVRSDDD